VSQLLFVFSRPVKIWRKRHGPGRWIEAGAGTETQQIAAGQVRRLLVVRLVAVRAVVMMTFSGDEETDRAGMMVRSCLLREKGQCKQQCQKALDECFCELVWHRVSFSDGNF
jgi:hypothetical protein